MVPRDRSQLDCVVEVEVLQDEIFTRSGHLHADEEVVLTVPSKPHLQPESLPPSSTGRIEAPNDSSSSVSSVSTLVVNENDEQMGSDIELNELIRSGMIMRVIGTRMMYRKAHAELEVFRDGYQPALKAYIVAQEGRNDANADFEAEFSRQWLLEGQLFTKAIQTAEDAVIQALDKAKTAGLSIPDPKDDKTPNIAYDVDDRDKYMIGKFGRPKIPIWMDGVGTEGNLHLRSAAYEERKLEEQKERQTETAKQPIVSTPAVSAKNQLTLDTENLVAEDELSIDQPVAKHHHQALFISTPTEVDVGGDDDERPRKRYHGGSESLTRTEIQKPARSDKRKRLENGTEALDEEPAHKRLRGNTSSDQFEKADEQSQGDTEQHAQVEKRKRLDDDGEADNEDPAHKRPRGDTSADEVEDDDEQAQGDTDKPVQGEKRKRVADDVETDDDEPGHKRLRNDASADEVEEADEQTQGDVVLIEYKESTDKTAPEPCHDSPLEPIPEERRHQSPIVKRTRDGEDDDRAQEEEKDMNEEEPKRLHFLDDLREVDAKLERRDGYISISERAYGNKRRRINMYAAQVRDGEW
jgi:hypothetical protein